MNKPLMPKATAMWLINQTTLTFDQIAEFCGLHALEIKAMADDMHPEKIVPLDPVMMGQLTREEITAAEKDGRKRLVMTKSAVEMPASTAKGRPRYTPVSRRGERPDAIMWLLRNHPELPESTVMKLVGTTKSTIAAIRDRTHWNAANIKPVDPVSLGLCSQLELDFAVQKAARKAGKGQVPDAAPVRTLIPAAEVVGTAANAAAVAAAAVEAERAVSPETVKNDDKQYDADSVFAKLKGLKLDPGAE